MKTSDLTNALLGLALGDALGVPFEFRTRTQMLQTPIRGMVGFGTHLQLKGTWSDDSSLTFCLAASLLNGYNLPDIAQQFVAWKHQGHWSARGEVFDIGITTSRAIFRLNTLLEKGDLEQLTLLKYQGKEHENGNGSLMRILPLIVYVQNLPIQEQFDIIWDVSALTHRHIRAAMCCLIYLKVIEHLLNGIDKVQSYQLMREEVFTFWEDMNFATVERQHFSKIIQEDIREYLYVELRGSGYVVESLEAALWCFLKEDTYQDVVFAAINLGEDTDTTAAIAGGLAGLYYGYDGMPEEWLEVICQKERIIDLGEQLSRKYQTGVR